MTDHTPATADRPTDDGDHPALARLATLDVLLDPDARDVEPGASEIEIEQDDAPGRSIRTGDGGQETGGRSSGERPSRLRRVGGSDTTAWILTTSDDAADDESQDRRRTAHWWGRRSPTGRSSPARSSSRTATASRSSTPSMPYQPGLDGLRAVSVIAVILYHAGFGWMHGGFFGVEVFFVVSGFLITALLIDERSGTGRVSLKQFWLRRARRLLPALAMLLAAVAVWAVAFGDDQQLSQLRRDLPWSIFYVANWGQILGDIPYYAGDPPLLRHLWSLGVEEQWYLVWPLLFVAIGLWRASATVKATAIGVAALASMAFTFWLHASGPDPIQSPIGVFDGIDRVNFMYLSTPSRASGLLLGAAAAFVWRPWRSTRAAQASAGRGLDVAGGIAVGMLGCTAAVATLTDGYVYQWLLPMVSLLSLLCVVTVVHPAATGMRAVFGWRPLVEIGKRSYGLYLWHWPIFAIAKASHGSIARFVAALAVTVVVSEVCYRFIETPVRRGALGRWWRSRPQRRPALLAPAAAVVTALVLFYASVDPFDRAAGGDDVSFSLTNPERPRGGNDQQQGSGDQASDGQQPGGQPSPSSTAPAETTPTALAPPQLPVSLTIVGDSQAHSLAINLPDGIESTFTVTDGSLDGCSVYDSGGVISSRDFDNSFGICADWQSSWATAASGSDVTLVVLGAWDVFDLETDSETLTFGTAAWDDYFLTNLRSGIDAITGGGSKVALLEVACMRPQDVEGAGVPALPERADDDRVAHLNALMRRVADQHPATTFVEGPDEWCNNEAVATDLGMRWDGVHVYVPGANLIFETVADQLLTIAAQ